MKFVNILTTGSEKNSPYAVALWKDVLIIGILLSQGFLVEEFSYKFVVACVLVGLQSFVNCPNGIYEVLLMSHSCAGFGGTITPLALPLGVWLFNSGLTKSDRRVSIPLLMFIIVIMLVSMLFELGMRIERYKRMVLFISYCVLHVDLCCSRLSELNQIKCMHVNSLSKSVQTTMDKPNLVQSSKLSSKTAKQNRGGLRVVSLEHITLTAPTEYAKTTATTTAMTLNLLPTSSTTSPVILCSESPELPTTTYSPPTGSGSNTSFNLTEQALGSSPPVTPSAVSGSDEQHTNHWGVTTPVSPILDLGRMWKYIDERGFVQGPFGTPLMRVWLKEGFLGESLLVAEWDSDSFSPLRDIMTTAFGSVSLFDCSFYS